MPIKDRTELKAEFQNGDIPDQNDFADTIDSALNLDEDGLVSYKLITPIGELKRFGMGGETTPDCPLGIKGEPGEDDKMICFTSFDETQKWNINLNPTGNDVDGFSIDDATSGPGSSRLFIDHVSQGNVGIGTVTPYSKLHVSGANDGGNVSIMVENQESGTEGGFLMSALDDNVVPERMKTFALHEKIGTELTERITVLGTHGPPAIPIINVGINEMLPYATLHVSKPASDPTQDLNLAENTGILCLGPIVGDNMVADTKRIQARHGEYVPGTSTLSFTTTEMCLQPYGGGLTVNCESATPGDIVSIGTDGKVGIGGTSDEKLMVNGAVIVGDTTTATPPDGTIRFGGPNGDLEVWKENMWNSLTTHTNTDGLWTDGGGGTIYYNPVGQHPKVGIGLEVPNATLHVKETNTEVVGNSGACAIVNQAATLIADPTKSRVGLGISCSGVWNPDPTALNIGLYIQSVTGQTTTSSNISALINGNTVLGSITGNTLVGDDATNVLAIQNGAAPTSTPGLTETTGIQIYSDNVGATAGTPGFSAFHLMTGDGAIMKLYRQPDMTPADPNLPDTGSVSTDDVIKNMRTRIGELENILKALGILTP